MKKILFLFFFLVVVLQSCTYQDKESFKPVKLDSIEKEISVLTSEKELNMLSELDEVVDWKLSREFAELALASFMDLQEFPINSDIWDLPVLIYGSDGNIKYYEYRIVSDSKTVGAIVCNANEKQGAPVAFILHLDGFNDEIESLYNTGIFTKNSLPRLIDNGYPQVLLARAVSRKNGGISYDALYDLETGETVSEVNEYVSFEDYIADFPESFTQEQISAVHQAMEDYRLEIADLWLKAKENKGSIITQGWGGSSSGKRVEADKTDPVAEEDFYTQYSKYNHIYKKSYGPCGASATGYILDTLRITGRGTVNESWFTMSNDECGKKLIDLMYMTAFDDQYITWPWNIHCGIEHYSNFTTYYVCGVPKVSLALGLPGISLKLGKYNGSISYHYRNVIAWESRGWWIFRWDYQKIYDSNGLDGGWEAFNPFLHWGAWNIQKK